MRGYAKPVTQAGPVLCLLMPSAPRREGSLGGVKVERVENLAFWYNYRGSAGAEDAQVRQG